jgi:hypothetical protein
MVIESLLTPGIAMFSVSITDLLNKWNEMGVFSYVLPFLLIFAVVYGILEKSGLFDSKSGSTTKPNHAVHAVIAVAVGLLALQLDFVSTFFQVIFPRFGVGIAIFLVLIILTGLFYKDTDDRGSFLAIGVTLAVAIALWALSSWDYWGDEWQLGYWFQDNFWAIVIGIIVVVSIYLIVKPDKTHATHSSGSGGGASG